MLAFRQVKLQKKSELVYDIKSNKSLRDEPSLIVETTTAFKFYVKLYWQSIQWISSPEMARDTSWKNRWRILYQCFPKADNERKNRLISVKSLSIHSCKWDQKKLSAASTDLTIQLIICVFLNYICADLPQSATNFVSLWIFTVDTFDDRYVELCILLQNNVYYFSLNTGKEGLVSHLKYLQLRHRLQNQNLKNLFKCKIGQINIHLGSEEFRRMKKCKTW